MPDDCLGCRELEGAVDVPGGFLWDAPLAIAFHIPPLPGLNPRPFLGHLLVVTRRHVARYGDLTPDEASAIGRVASRLARALTDFGGADWVYSAVIGTGVPHFHQHLISRYPGTPRDLPWHDEWKYGPHGGAREIAELSEKLRAGLGADLKLTEITDTGASKSRGGGSPVDGEGTVQGS